MSEPKQPTFGAIELPVISVQPMTFNDKQTGKETTMYRVYFLLADGGVGFVYSNHEKQPGELAALRIASGGDGRLSLKLV